MNMLRSAWAVIAESRRLYVVLNLIYFGLVGVGLIYTTFDPSVHTRLMESVGESLTQGPLAPVLEAYTGGAALRAAALTFAVNLAVGSFVTITLPSLVIPFSGLLLGGYRALLWGFLFAPVEGGIGEAGLAIGALIAVLILLEGEAYVLAMFGALVQARAFLWPRRAGVEGVGKGYWLGLKRTARVYLLIVGVLLLAAVYEVAIALFALPRLG